MADAVLPSRSISFLEGVEHGDEIVIPKRLFDQWVDLFPEGQCMLAKLVSVETGLERIVCIGGADTTEFLYVPNWILQHLGSEETFLSIEPLTQEFPAATKITLKPLDNAIYHTDLRKEIELYLDRFHVLEAGTTLSVPLKDLDGYEIGAFVEAVEPPGVVRLGGEVFIEFLEPDGGIPEHAPPEPNEVIEAPVEVPVNTLTKEEQQKLIQASWAKRFASMKQ
jgi:hypothetical protein